MNLKMIIWLTVVTLALSINAVKIGAQSVESNNPTPITSNEIRGEIAVRDIGDSRATTYYYYFNGNQGDIFINVKTTNFSGDIDIYTAEGIKPRTKMVIYADEGESETGRVVYQRQNERLILRIQGKAYLDVPAVYQIKFAGSFGAVEGVEASTKDDRPKVSETETGAVKVNSVGTIIEEPKVEIVAVTKNDEGETKIIDKEIKTETSVNPVGKFDPRKDPVKAAVEAADAQKPKVIIEDPNAKEGKEVTVTVADSNPNKSSTIVTIERSYEEETPPSAEVPAVEKSAKAVAARLAKTKLVISLTNGKVMEFRMNKISSFNIFDGVLKVVAIDGTTTKYSILEVQDVSIRPVK